MLFSRHSISGALLLPHHHTHWHLYKLSIQEALANQLALDGINEESNALESQATLTKFARILNTHTYDL